MVMLNMKLYHREYKQTKFQSCTRIRLLNLCESILRNSILIPRNVKNIIICVFSYQVHHAICRRKFLKYKMEQCQRFHRQQSLPKISKLTINSHYLPNISTTNLTFEELKRWAMFSFFLSFALSFKGNQQDVKFVKNKNFHILPIQT